MLPKKAVFDFKSLVEKDMGREISDQQAEDWTQNFFALMILLLSASEKK